VYRIAQEALTNLVRHARAPAAVVRVHASNGTLELFVDDKGCGFDVEAARGAGGLGLVSMSERARAAGGTLNISSSAGAGTSVHLRLPIGGPR
jgi:signal transduction histidine kinase